MKEAIRKILGTSVLKNSSIYMVIAFLQKAIGFLLLPLYTTLLTPTDYGRVSVVNTLVGFLSVIYSLSLQGAASRFYYKYKDDPERTKKIWGTCFTFVMMNTVLLSLVFGCFHSVLLDPFAENVAFNPYILIGLIATGLSPVFSYYQVILQTSQDGKRYGLNNLFFFVLNVSLIIVFIVALHWGAVGILAANAISNGVFFVYSLWKILPRIRFGIDKSILVEALKYSLPLIPYNLSSFIALMIDRLFLNKITGTAQVGIYSVGYQFANLVNVFTAAVAQAYSPWFFNQIEKGAEGRERVRRTMGLAISVFSFVGLFVSLASPFALDLMVSRAFSRAWIVIPPLAMGYAFYGTYLLVCNGLYIAKTYYLPLITAIGAAMNIILNVILIPRLGMFGAAVSGMFYNVFITVFLVLLVERVEKIGYRARDLWFSALVCFPLSFVTYSLGGISPLARAAVSLGICVAAGLAIYLLNKKIILTWLTHAGVKKERRE